MRGEGLGGSPSSNDISDSGSIGEHDSFASGPQSVDGVSRALAQAMKNVAVEIEELDPVHVLGSETHSGINDVDLADASTKSAGISQRQHSDLKPTDIEVTVVPLPSDSPNSFSSVSPVVLMEQDTLRSDLSYEAGEKSCTVNQELLLNERVNGIVPLDDFNGPVNRVDKGVDTRENTSSEVNVQYNVPDFTESVPNIKVEVPEEPEVVAIEESAEEITDNEAVDNDPTAGNDPPIFSAQLPPYNPDLKPPDHLKAALPEKYYGCEHCGDKFLFPYSLFRHTQRRSMVINYHCEACEKVLTFYNRCTLLEHFREHPKPTDRSIEYAVTPLPTELIDLKPPDCDLGSDYDLLQNIASNFPPVDTGDKRKCFECKQLFPSEEAARLHFVNSEDDKTVIFCSVCHLFFPNNCNFRAHKRYHDQKKPHICPECRKEFKLFASFSLHLTHSCFHTLKQTRYRCEKCRVTFPLQVSLSVHILNVHIKHVYKCSICPIACYTSNLLDIHKTKVHQNPFVPTTQYQQCQLCPNRLIVKTRVLEHATEHTRKKSCFCYVYCCDKCKVCAETKQDFRLHRSKCKETENNLLKPSTTPTTTTTTSPVIVQFPQTTVQNPMPSVKAVIRTPNAPIVNNTVTLPVSTTTRIVTRDIVVQQSAPVRETFLAPGSKSTDGVNRPIAPMPMATVTVPVLLPFNSQQVQVPVVFRRNILNPTFTNLSTIVHAPISESSNKTGDKVDNSSAIQTESHSILKRTLEDGSSPKSKQLKVSNEDKTENKNETTNKEPLLEAEENVKQKNIDEDKTSANTNTTTSQTKPDVVKLCHKCGESIDNSHADNRHSCFSPESPDQFPSPPELSPPPPGLFDDLNDLNYDDNDDNDDDPRSPPKLVKNTSSVNTTPPPNTERVIVTRASKEVSTLVDNQAMKTDQTDANEGSVVSPKSSQKGESKENFVPQKKQKTGEGSKMRLALNGPSRESGKETKVTWYKCHLCKALLMLHESTIKKHFELYHTDIQILGISTKVERLDNNRTVASLKIMKKQESTPVKPAVTRSSTGTGSVEIQKTPQQQPVKKEEPKQSSPKGKRKGKRTPRERKKKQISPFKSGLTVSSATAKAKSKFQCSKCTFETSSKDEFQTHIKSHRVDTSSFQCTECGMCFVVEPSLVKHLYVSHRIKDPSPYLENVHSPSSPEAEASPEKSAQSNRCKVCFETFDTRLELDKHFRVHGMAFLLMKRHGTKVQ